MEYEYKDLQLTGNKELDMENIDKLKKEGWKAIGIASNFMAFKKEKAPSS